MIDAAGAGFGLATHGADPQRAGWVHAPVIGTVARQVAFQLRMQCQHAGRGVAQEKPVIGGDQLLAVADLGERAAHEGQGMYGLAAGGEMQLMQFALENIEPPGGAAGGVEGRAFAKQHRRFVQNTSCKGKNGRQALILRWLHHRPRV